MRKILLILLLPIITFAQKEVVVQMNTDQYPTETRWVLYADSLYGIILDEVSYGYYTQPNTSHSDTFYIPDNLTNVTFIIWDSYGDGMSGSYYVDICGDNIISNPAPSFSYGYYHNRIVPQCMPNPPPGVPARVIINLDQYQGETSWDIKDSTGTIHASGGSYNSQPDYATVITNVSIPKGDLIFTIYDTYGDGLNGALWQGQDGSYYVVQCNDTLIYGTNPAFGNDTSHVFVSDSCPPIFGCTNINYIEYNPLADVDDSSCVVLKVFGCLDSTMFNYDSTANTMNLIDSCGYTLLLHDLMGNGWVGSNLQLMTPDTVYNFTHSGGFIDTFNIGLTAPDLVTFKFFISAQASLTTIECGFTLINPEGNILIDIQPPFIQPLLPYNVITNCGNTCIEKVFGCMDSLAVNYVDTANTENNTCYYFPGCTNSSYLEYYTQGFVADYNNGSCLTQAIWGCVDSTAFNYDTTANIDNGGCVAVVVGCMQPLAFNYNPQANTSGPCVAIVYGCMSSIAINYNPLANTDDGSCIGVVYGCTNPAAFNYNPNANTNNGSCVPVITGCTDPTMFNYDQSANTDNGSCIPFVYGCMDTSAFNYDPLVNTDNGTCVPIILGCTNPIALNYCDSCNVDDFSCILPIYGCTDSTMFNYNPLANVDNNSCILFIYGCTDPSMLNYNPEANTEDFSCIAYIYGCMDSLALNYDSLANTDNGSCIEIIMGCMDPDAYNYESLANTNDSLSCLYSANCITGPGYPYWLNDPCYAWVIDVDDYCCENEWDSICQLTYNYCDSTYIGPLPQRINNNKELIMITDILGRPTKEIKNQLLFYIYSDGTIEKKLIKK